MAQNNKPNKSGRKPLVDEEVDLIFRKLEPYLKKGLSLHKACLEAQIPFGRTGAIDLELLLPLANAIIENWNIGTFEQIMLIKNNEDYSRNYVF